MDGRHGEISRPLTGSNGGTPLGFGGYLKPSDRDKFGILLVSSDFLQALRNLNLQPLRPGTCCGVAAYVVSSLVSSLAEIITLMNEGLVYKCVLKRSLADLQCSSIVTSHLKSISNLSSEAAA